MQNLLYELAERYSLLDRIDFKSNLSKEELSYEYSSSDVFVFPSQREGFGISVSEAISHNLPVILYDVPENASITLLEGMERSSKLPNLDTDVWVEEITRLLVSKIDAVELNQTSFMNWANVSKMYMDFLSSVLKSRYR